MEKERGLDRAAAIADMRFGFIEKSQAVSCQPRESREHRRSVKIDRLLTGTYTAIPAFIAIMGLVFWLTFNVIGAVLSDGLELVIGWLTERADAALTAAGINPVLHSLLIDGVCNGVGSVLSFLPIIVTLFFFLSLLEDSGYMARVAFVMDKLLRKIGLSGRSIVPMLIGFGCTVPGVMASRTLSSERGSKNDDPVDSVYELFRQDFDLCVFYRRLFPTSWGDCYDCTLSVGNPDGNFDGNAS